MFEDEVEELMCDYGLSPMDAHSIATELRKTRHALWMTRAYNGFNTTYNLTSYHNYMIEHPNTKVTPRRWYHCWKTVERKCIEKAKEYK